jgi:hypothetical protein
VVLAAVLVTGVDADVVDAVLEPCFAPPQATSETQPSTAQRVCAECLTFSIERPITTPGEEGAVCAVRQKSPL